MTTTHHTILRAEELDDRTLPSATILSLMSRGAEVTGPSGFIARQVDAQPTGTGHIQSFVRVQGAASGGGSQQGYNTVARPLQYDENKSPQFTRAITLGEVPVVEVGGVAYREFLLDINQKSSSPRLSLDQVRVFLGDRPDLRGYNPTAKTLDGLSAHFDLDAGGDVSLLLDARLNSGSGSGDMTLLIPESAFAGASPNAYVYLYSQMGAVAGATANGGFEEWAVRRTPVAPPQAGTASIGGYVFVDNNGNGRLDEGETGIANVTIYLRGVNDLGQNVDLIATTDANGYYQFTQLRAGTYSLLEVQPAGFADGTDYVGTIDGVSDASLYGLLNPELDDNIIGISLGTGQQGVDYNFTEFYSE